MTPNLNDLTTLKEQIFGEAIKIEPTKEQMEEFTKRLDKLRMDKVHIVLDEYERILKLAEKAATAYVAAVAPGNQAYGTTIDIKNKMVKSYIGHYDGIMYGKAFGFPIEHLFDNNALVKYANEAKTAYEEERAKLLARQKEIQLKSINAEAQEIENRLFTQNHLDPKGTPHRPYTQITTGVQYFAGGYQFRG